MEKGNQCAFPADSKTQTDGGLTKREYIATFAMHGLLVIYAQDGRYDGTTQQPEVAEMAVKQADELLKHLNKPQE